MKHKQRNNQLVISSTITTDEGIYQCVAENAAGWISAPARLKITNRNLTPMYPPTNLRARTLSSTEIELFWDPPQQYVMAYTIHYHDSGRIMKRLKIWPASPIAVN